MMPKLKYLLYLSMVVLVQGCATQSYVSLDLVYPAKVTLPATMQGVRVVNHAISQGQTGAMDANTLHERNFDLLLSSYVTRFVQESLAESPRLQVKGSDTLLYKPVEVAYQPLTEPELNALKQTADADAVLALEHIQYGHEEVEIKTADAMGYYTEASYRFVVQSLWNLYLPGVHKPYQRSFVDTLYFPEIRNEQHFTKVLADREGSEWLAYQIADNYHSMVAHTLAPYWVQQYRMYYVGGNTDLKKAANKVRAGDWNGAVELWKPYAEGSGRVSALCAFNIALAAEAQNQIDLALFWVQKSFEIHPSDDAENYLKELQKRQKQIEQLNLQFGNRNN